MELNKYRCLNCNSKLSYIHPTLSTIKFSFLDIFSINDQKEYFESLLRTQEFLKARFSSLFPTFTSSLVINTTISAVACYKSIFALFNFFENPCMDRCSCKFYNHLNMARVTTNNVLSQNLVPYVCGNRSTIFQRFRGMRKHIQH